MLWDGRLWLCRATVEIPDTLGNSYVHDYVLSAETLLYIIVYLVKGYDGEAPQFVRTVLPFP